MFVSQGLLRLHDHVCNVLLPFKRYTSEVRLIADFEIQIVEAIQLFHELLHIFLSRHPIENSALLKEHAAEHERVRDHLHLLALQKAVLLKLNEPDALKEVMAVDSALPGGYYKRAWELINATDKEYLKYVAELSK